MTDTPPRDPTLASIQVNAQYVKDLSFEMPNAPAIFADLQHGAPEIGFQINLATNPIQEKVYETVLTLRLEGKIAGKTAFLLELSYAGMFTLNLPEDQIQPVLYIECPRLLFPFARAIVADTTRDSGLPPIMLQPIDFVSLFRQRLEQINHPQA